MVLKIEIGWREIQDVVAEHILADPWIAARIAGCVITPERTDTGYTFHVDEKDEDYVDDEVNQYIASVMNNND